MFKAAKFTFSRFAGILALLTLSSVLSGCEARLNLDGVEEERQKAVRRTDQIQGLISSETSIVAVGSNGLVLTSARHPLNWTRTELGGGPNFIDIDRCPDDTMVALSVEGGVWVTENEGQSWSANELPTRENVLSLTCAPDGSYWVVGSFSTILSSSDRGRNWKEFSLGEDAMLTEIQFLDPLRAIITGEFGLVLGTEDGGKSWESVGTIPGEFYPIGSYFADERRGWVAGLNGTVLHTTDGGRTWRPQKTETDFPLYGFYAEQSRLYAFGDHSTVLELDGERWVALNTPPYPGYLRGGVSAAPDRILFAGGRGNLFTLNTNDRLVAERGPSNDR